MRHSPRLFAMAGIFAIIFAFGSTRRASAASCIIYDITAYQSASFTGSVVAFHTYTLTLFANGVPVLGPETNTATTDGPFSASVASVGKTVRILFVDDTLHCDPAVTYFNPGDARLNGQPGDHLVVYCNADKTPANIDVWAVDNNSVGHELTEIPLSALTSVANGQYSKNLGANGVLSAGLDASGNGYAALQGGPYNGTATSDWLKTFSCKG